MTIPVLLVSGFLGAGKTTLVNRLLREPQGRRIAAVVNDFGAIDIDAALLGSAADDVVSLRNGCICCKLQGDLLRTLAGLTRRRPAPDAIVIETSGASDPAEIVRSLLDPVIFAATPLDTVVSVVDARTVSDRPGLQDDPLWLAQLRAADFVVMSKADLVTAAELAAIRESLARRKPRTAIVEAVDGAVPPDFLFSRGEHMAGESGPGRPIPCTDRFEAISWTATRPLSMARFQDAIARLSPKLIRAKGIVHIEHQADPLVFQLVGSRATMVRAPPGTSTGTMVRVVLIGEFGRLDRKEAAEILEGSVSHAQSAIEP